MLNGNGNAFTSPEMLQGQCDECSDVYALGALLYLLFTRYAPVAPTLRLLSENREEDTQEHENSGSLHPAAGLSLLPPHLLNSRISSRLEHILTRALALEPAQRFPTVFALVEALESIDADAEFIDPFATQPQQRVRQDSRVTKMLEWVKRELND